MDVDNVIRAKLRAQDRWNELTPEERARARQIVERVPSILRACWVTGGPKGRCKVEWVMT